MSIGSFTDKFNGQAHMLNYEQSINYLAYLGLIYLKNHLRAFLRDLRIFKYYNMIGVYQVALLLICQKQCISSSITLFSY